MTEITIMYIDNQGFEKHNTIIKGNNLAEKIEEYINNTATNIINFNNINCSAFTPYIRAAIDYDY